MPDAFARIEPAPIAIVGAMHEEIAALLAAMPDEAPERVAGREFWRGHLDGTPVVIEGVVQDEAGLARAARRSKQAKDTA